MIQFESKLSWMQKVYLVTDPEQDPWLLVGVHLTPNGELYNLSRNGETIDVFAGEFTSKIDKKLKLGLSQED